MITESTCPRCAAEFGTLRTDGSTVEDGFKSDVLCDRCEPCTYGCGCDTMGEHAAALEAAADTAAYVWRAIERARRTA